MIPSYFKIEIWAISDEFITQEHKGLTVSQTSKNIRSSKDFGSCMELSMNCFYDENSHKYMHLLAVYPNQFKGDLKIAMSYPSFP